MANKKFKAGDWVTYTKYLPKMDRHFFKKGPRQIRVVRDWLENGAPYMLMGVSYWSFKAKELRQVRKSSKMLNK